MKKVQKVYGETTTSLVKVHLLVSGVLVEETISMKPKLTIIAETEKENYLDI